MSDPGFNIAELVKDMADTHQRLVQQGIQIGEARFCRAIRTVDVAYRHALLDPDTKIPSYMEAALYALIAMLPAEETVEAKVATTASGK